jgi:SAM-dependent methyltransferase
MLRKDSSSCIIAVNTRRKYAVAAALSVGKRERETFMTDDSPGDNTYLLDPESPEEMARLMNLDRFTTKAMGGPLAGIADSSRLQTILDLACGPGGWVLDVAFACPDAEIAGVDISKIMIEYANARARTQKLFNATFGIMDITKPLDFSDATFDLVNARLLIAVLRREAWAPLISECARILRPGGLLRLTEPIDPGVTNSPAFERLQVLVNQALWQAGYGFSVDGRTYGLSHTLPRLLRQAGYQNVQYRAYMLEYSAETPAWADFYRNAQIVYYLGRFFPVKAGLATQEEVEHLYQQMLIEMHRDDFACMGHFFSVWGEKPSDK